MKRFQFIFIVIALTIMIIMSNCTGNEERSGDTGSRETVESSKGAHSRDTGESESAEGEESRMDLAQDQTYDNVRNGARLVLSYDAESNTFNGTVENTTSETLRKVRVEIHLSNGIELGPTTAVNLKPGAKKNVKLAATEKKFERWNAHPEVGGGEHGHGEGESEHGERSDEHDEKGEGEHE
jgi:hypothetical protein